MRDVDVRHLHGLVMEGRLIATPYRDGQNVIRDSNSGTIVYMPPEADDVPKLMNEMLEWIAIELQRGEIPVPIVAALAHYQFATIHPYYDGNGRTARLLTTLILQRTGYGLKGIYSLEEYYARNLSGYYTALTVGGSHNHYFGRREADVTEFVAYFCRGIAEAFAAVQEQAEKAARRGGTDQSGSLRNLDPRRRRLITLFRRQGSANTSEIAEHLGLTQRTVVALCRAWVKEGFLELQDPSRKNRAYRLAPPYEATVTGY